MKGEPATGIPMSQGYAPTPPSEFTVPPGQGEWSTGLCDCFSDCSNCCLTCWCPCITFGQIAEIVDRGSSSCGVHGALYALLMAFVGCQWVYSCTYRSRLKRQYGIPENSCADCCAHFWCEWCALCQEYRELQHRGYDVPLGWYGNMERQNREMSMAPQVPSGMTR